MIDWKSSLVKITVYKMDEWVVPVLEAKKFLDTDTITDIFDIYDPLIHSITIEPYRAEGIIEEDEDIG